MDKKIGIITFAKYEGRQNIGSSKIRGEWLVKYWDDAEIFVQGRKYETVIYQKAYWLDHIRKFDGLKVLDICDPDFLSWPYKIKEICDNVDGIVTSTEALAEAIRNFTDKPVICIPDRLDLSVFDIKKVHRGRAKNVVWFGYSHNAELLGPVITHLEKRNLNLVIVSNKEVILSSNYNNRVKVSYFKWENDEDAYRDIIKGDICVNPTSSIGKWKYKSNNKTITAWALGLPVATTVEDLDKFIEVDKRIKEVEKRQRELKEKWDVRLSVNEYKEFLDKLRK